MAISSALRAELNQRAEAYARRHEIPYLLSLGQSPTVLFEPYDDGRRHGNFLPGTYGAMLAHDPWKRRLGKRHPMFKRMPRNERGHWNELDSSISSDALLMNAFCYPRTLRMSNGHVGKLLGEEPDVQPYFGFKARVPLSNGHLDRTEVDLRFGNLLVEAKLTESGFQRKNKTIVEGYRDFAEVFDRSRLPQTRDDYLGYQLIRNVLAAHATGCSFCVLCDDRRADLKDAWAEVLQCVRVGDLRRRSKLLTWQELASELPEKLQEFLEEKYGIA